jgi:hypothetical protein
LIGLVLLLGVLVRYSRTTCKHLGKKLPEPPGMPMERKDGGKIQTKKYKQAWLYAV